ncbi:hypothetical protein RJ640_019300 [Escallonia rubra]|uniref:Uncharacterized protein n=1 Tax=Escallonia rubra TaxID=112253 RepID=A0AA88RAI1_9ASTE|nr:hypothetical protein RJ640_019300 [Escallonia rubra]
MVAMPMPMLVVFVGGRDGVLVVPWYDWSFGPNTAKLAIGHSKEEIFWSSSDSKATAVVKSSSLGRPNGSSVERKLSKFNSKATGEKDAKESFPTQRSKSLDCGSNGLEEASKHSDKKLEPTNRPEAPQKINSSNSSFKKEDKRIEAPKEVKEGEAILIDDEMAAASLLLELLRHGKENKIKRRQMKKQKSVRKAEVYSMDEDCDSDSTLTQQLHQLRKRQSNPQSVQEPCLSAELGLVSFSKAKYKRKGESEMGDRTSSNGKIKKRKAPDGGLNSLSLADKKRKLCPSLPVREETKELKGLESLTELEGLTDSTMEEELWSPKCSSTDGSDTEAVNALPSTATLVDRRAIAKQYKLKCCSKLPKADLAKQLGSLLNDIGSSDAKECLTCKGEVTIENLTPIYGCGSYTHKPKENSSLEIPPRPQACRKECRRRALQRFEDVPFSGPVEEISRH